MKNTIHMLFSVIIFLLCFGKAIADVSLYSPAPHEAYVVKVHENTTLSVAWVESGATPHLDKVHNYTFVLCNGTNDKINSIATVGKGVSAARLKSQDNTFNITLSPALVAHSGVFFLQVVASGAKFVTIHYTNRFKAVFEDDTRNSKHYEELLQLPSPYAETIRLDQKQTSSSSAKSINTQYYTIPYERQTKLGSIRYAPMQPTPRNTTKKGRWTSPTTKTHARKPFTEARGLRSGTPRYPNVEYTVTQPPTKLQVTSANTIDHAHWPSHWYNPSQRVTPPTLRRASVTDSKTKV